MKRLISMPFSRKWLPIIFVLAYFLPLIIVNGAVDMFLKIEGVPGESQDAKHQDWIEILSWSHGVEVPVTGIGSGRTAGAADLSDISLVKTIDKSTPLLMKSCCEKMFFPLMEIDMVHSNSTSGITKYMKYTLSDVIITSVKPDMPSGEDSRPQESITLNYAEVNVSYEESDSEGQVFYSTNVTCIAESD